MITQKTIKAGGLDEIDKLAQKLYNDNYFPMNPPTLVDCKGNTFYIQTFYKEIN